MPTKSFTAYRLRFTGPLHIADSRDDYGTSLRSISSDTMYAALTATLAKMGKEIPADGDLGCVISALFPFYRKDFSQSPILFFPKPLALSLPRLTKENAAEAKKMKKVKWVDRDYLQDILAGKDVFASPPDGSHLKGEFLTSGDFDESFLVSEVLERVTVSRTFEDSKPFYMERLHFKGDSGLFFLVDGDTALVDEALPLLSAEGIGTDRNVGNGTFEFEKEKLEVNLPDDAEYGVSLSTFIPEDKPQLESLLNGESVAYELLRRGGWIATPPYLSLRKNAIYAFAPGSVFHVFLSGSGRIVDLAPKGLVHHPIWRCGKALVLPIKL